MAELSRLAARGARSFESLANSREESYTLTGTERAQRLRGRRVTGNFFHVLGVSPALGRGFTDDDDRPNAAPRSDRQRRILANASSAPIRQCIGRTLKLDDVAYTIVGVMPRGFQYLRPYDLFSSMGPIAATPNAARPRQPQRLLRGRTAEARRQPSKQPTASCRRIAAALEREYPEHQQRASASAPSRSPIALVADIRLTLLALLGAVGFLLLIACVNVANLLIARGAARQHELAVRAALGGGRMRLASQLLVESTLVSAAGGVLGVGVASWLLRALVAVAPEGTPRIGAVHLDGAALLFATGRRGDLRRRVRRAFRRFRHPA